MAQKSFTILFHSTFGRKPYRLSKQGFKGMGDRQLVKMVELGSQQALIEANRRINRGRKLRFNIVHPQLKNKRGIGGVIVTIPVGSELKLAV